MSSSDSTTAAMGYHESVSPIQIISYQPPPLHHDYDDDDDDYIVSDATATAKKRHRMQKEQQHHPQQSPTLREDRYWSILSNSFFVAGCFISLIGNSWDYILYTKYNNINKAVDDDDIPTISTTSDQWQYVAYQSLSILWPFIFLMNSIVDVKWALVVQERIAQNKSHTTITKFVHKLLANNPTQGRKRNSLLLNTALVVPQNVLRRTRNHFGHRRQLGAATAFGIAASLSVSAAIVNVIRKNTFYGQENWDSLSYWMDMLKYASVHMYLISAVLTLWKLSSTSSYCGGGGEVVGWNARPWLTSSSRSSDSSDNSASLPSNNNNATRTTTTTTTTDGTPPGGVGGIQNQQPIPVKYQQDEEGIVVVTIKDQIKWYSNVEFLGTVGDVIFGLATVVDVILQDCIYHEDAVYIWPIVQAAVWSIDALLYLRSDYLSLNYVSVAYLWKDRCGHYV
jgi:hypothetical protein